MHGLEYREPEKRRKEDRQHFARIGCKQELNGLSNVVIDAPALLNGGDDGGKVIVRKHHIRDIFCDIRAGNAHADADIGGLNACRIVDAVAGHCRNAALALPSGDYAYLVLGLNTGIDADFSEACLELGIGHL